MPKDAPVVTAKDVDPTNPWGGRVPIMLGVTGHRDIDMKSEPVCSAIYEQCCALREQYPNSPFVILSGLAEGADRLVAGIAMETLDAALVAVLPMPSAEFESDFDSAASKAEFAEMLQKALGVREVEAPSGVPGWKEPGEARNERYARVGAIIVDHAQVLFAIWDGEPSRGTGGTAEVVSWFDRGFAPLRYSLYEAALSPLDPPEPGRLIWIDAKSGNTAITDGPKASHRHRSAIAWALRIFSTVGVKHGGRRTAIERILRRTDTYNQDILRHPDAIAKSRKLASEGVVKRSGAGFTNAAYRATDGLSVHYASIARFADICVYSLALLAFFSFNFVNERPGATWAYFVITLIMVILGGRVWLRSIDHRFLEYRSLAEAMRVMFFWRAAGIRRPVWLAYLSRHSGVVHWIRHATRTLEFCQDCLLPPPSCSESQITRENLAVVKAEWLVGQINFFTKGLIRHGKRAARLIRFTRVAIGASFLIAFGLAYLAIDHREGGSLWAWDALLRPWSNQLQVVLGMLAAVGLAARGFLARRADRELRTQYAAQRQVFEIAFDALGKCEMEASPEWTPTQILESLGEEALQEQAEWLWLRHSRPFEIPS
jgi:hypothetical protein